MNGFLLLVVNMQRGTASGGDLDDEIVKGSTGIFAREFKDEIAGGPGLKSQSLSWGQNFV